MNNQQGLRINQQRRINDKQGSMIFEEWTIKNEQG